MILRSRSLGGNQDSVASVVKYHSQFIQCIVNIMKNNNWPIFILNFNFWFAFKNVIILPSLNNRTIFSIPRNLRFRESDCRIRVIISRGSEAIKSTPNLPYNTYCAAILFPIENKLVSATIFISSSKINENIKDKSQINHPIKNIHENIRVYRVSKFIWY